MNKSAKTMMQESKKASQLPWEYDLLQSYTSTTAIPNYVSSVGDYQKEIEPLREIWESIQNNPEDIPINYKYAAIFESTSGELVKDGTAVISCIESNADLTIYVPTLKEVAKTAKEVYYRHHGKQIEKKGNTKEKNIRWFKDYNEVLREEIFEKLQGKLYYYQIFFHLSIIQLHSCTCTFTIIDFSTLRIEY